MRPPGRTSSITSVETQLCTLSTSKQTAAYTHSRRTIINTRGADAAFFTPAQRQTGSAVRRGSHYHNTTLQVTQAGGSPDSRGQTACVPHVFSSTLDKRSLLTVLSGDDVTVSWCSSWNGGFAVVTWPCCRLSDDLLIARGQSELAHAAFFPLFGTSALGFSLSD